MIRISQSGHLVKMRSRTSQREEYLFLYLTGGEPRGAYKTVIKGIRDLKLRPSLEEKAELKAEAIENFSLIEQDLVQTMGSRIYRLPVTAFYDHEKKVFRESLFLGGLVNVIEKEGNFFPTNRLTAVATGSDFFDREKIIQKIWKHLSNKESVYLSGSRRYGKTSLLKRIEEMARSSQYRPIMIDLENVTGPEVFLAKLVSEVEGSDLSESKKEEKRFDLVTSWGDQWMKQGSAYLKKILGRKPPFLFILDEWPYMLDTFLCKEEGGPAAPQEKTREFVAWFGQKRASLQGRSVFLLSGSITLEVYLQDNNLNRESFSDLREIRVDYFDRETIRDYLDALLLGDEIILPDKINRRLAQWSLPGIPYFIQILANMAESLYQKTPLFPIRDLQEAYERITGQEGRRYFDTFERHFKCYGHRKPGAKAVLKALAKAGEKGLDREVLQKMYCSFISPSIGSTKEFHLVLNYLEHDFYIEKIKETGRFRFASPLLRDYWRKNQ